MKKEQPSPSVPGRVVAFLASLRLTVIGLLLLLVLTVWGTLYQVDHGLYGAQIRFYQSWYFLAADFIPFPGAQTVMTLLCVNLAMSMGRMLWLRKFKLGYFITHAGLLLMLTAGAVTFYFGQESHLSLLEGESSNVSASGKDWELAIWPAAKGAEIEIMAVDAGAFKAGDVLTPPSGGMQIEVEDYLPNCSAGEGTLRETPSARDPEDNLPGLNIKITPQGGEPSHLTLWGGVDRPDALKIGGQTYAFSLRHRRFPLPATIKLIDFKKVMHPGSGMAKSFSSDVVVRPERGAERNVLISMNKPLRISGYTFYQSSYMQMNGGQEMSVFAVVKNYGRVMPYVATGLTAAGMILHFFGMLLARTSRLRGREAKAA